MNSLLNVVGVAAIITGLISLFGILIGLWFNYRENRTSRYVNIITKQTLENNIFIRENSEILTVLTRPEIINDARTRHDIEYKIKLMRAEVNIEAQFKYALWQEREMINILRKLVKCSFKYFDAPTEELEAEIRALGEMYYEKMTIYDYADWLYIKNQAQSRAYNKNYENFDEIYAKELNNNFREEDIPTPW